MVGAVETGNGKGARMRLSAEDGQTLGAGPNAVVRQKAGGLGVDFVESCLKIGGGRLSVWLR